MLNKGAVTYKDGKLHTNEKIYNYYLKQILLNRNSEAQKTRKEFIELEAAKRAEEYSNKHAIQNHPGLFKFYKRKVTREFDRKERKELKRLYKLNGKRLKLEKKHGKLIDDNLI